MNSSVQVFDEISISNIKVVALSRNGGLSQRPFDSLNLADYVGDDSAAVSGNLAIVSGLVGASGLAVMAANHGKQVHVVSHSGVAPSGDGLVTTEENLALLALAADCVGFALADPVAGVIAIGHAGWRGVLANVVQEVVVEFARRGGQPAHSTAVIGPAICAECYEVPRDRVAKFLLHCPAAVFDETHLDLRAGVRSILSHHINQIHEFSGCTRENEKLFSYRGAGGQPTGRGGLLVVRTSS
jgi:YfiH family protein